MHPNIGEKVIGPATPARSHSPSNRHHQLDLPLPLLLLLFAMIRSVVKSFKVPGVEVVASRMSNEAALTRMIDSTPKKLGHT